MGVFKINISTDMISNMLSNNAVDEEEFKSGQQVLVDGPKIGMMSSWSELPPPSVLIPVVMIQFCPHFIFHFPYLSQSHDLMSPDRSPDPCHLTGRSPDFLVT